MNWIRRQWQPIVLIVVVWIVFWGALSHPFLAWDDEALIVLNPLVRTFSPRIFASYDPELYIPITLLTFQLNYFIAGLQPLLFHATNILLHAINTVLVFWLGAKVIGRRGPAFLCALLFAVHPMNVEAVAWVSARKELLSATFLLGSILFFLHDRWRTSVGSGALAMMSKVTAVILPVVLLPLHSLRLKDERWPLYRQLPYWVMALLFGVVAIVGKANVVDKLSGLQKPILALQSLSFYVQKLIVPTGLSAIYPAPVYFHVSDVRTLAGSGLVILIAISIWYFWKRLPVAAWSMLFFLSTLVPSFFAYMKSNTVTLAADRYAYIPSIGFVLLITAIVYTLATSPLLRRLMSGIALLIAVLFAYQSQMRVTVWTSESALFQDVLRTYPDSAIALNNVANEQLEVGNIDAAFSLVDRALQSDGDYADAHATMGAIYGRKGDLNRAESDLMIAIRLNPELAQAYFNLGGISYVRKNWEAAIAEYKKTIELQPYHADAYRQLANTYLRMDRRDDARAAYAKAVEIQPDFAGQFSTLDALLQE